MINLMLRTADNKIYSYSTDTKTGITLTASSIRPYNIISDIFNFQVGDLVILVTAGSGRVRNIIDIYRGVQKLITETSIHIKRVFVFSEDLFIVKDDTAEEIKFFKKLKENLQCDYYEFYHCERHVNQLDTRGLNIQYFDWFVTARIQEDHRVQGIKELEYNFEKKICCLNRRFDEHRYLACAVLSNYRDAYYTQQYGLEDTKMFQLNVDALSDTIVSNVLEGFENLKKAPRIIDRSVPVETIDNFEYFSNTAMHNLNSKTTHAFCSLVTESRFCSDFPNFSEKTLRAIHCGRPFLLLAPPGTLKLLQQLGIKTFSEFWDESYDDIQDHTQRFDRVMEIAVDILSRTDLSIEPLKSILEYNMHELSNVPRRMLELNL
jgi:hypothetical protein